MSFPSLVKGRGVTAVAEDRFLKHTVNSLSVSFKYIPSFMTVLLDTKSAELASALKKIESPHVCFTLGIWCLVAERIYFALCPSLSNTAFD